MNQKLYNFQSDLTKRIDQAKDEGLTTVEIIGTMEAIKAKIWEMTFTKAKALAMNIEPWQPGYEDCPGYKKAIPGHPGYPCPCYPERTCPMCGAGPRKIGIGCLNCHAMCFPDGADL